VKTENPLHIGILASSDSWYCRDLERAASARGHRCTRLDFSRLAGQHGTNREDGPALTASEIKLTAFDCILVRTMPPGSLEQVVFRMDLLARVESAGVRVVNSPKAVECAVDKYLTTARLEAAGLSVPPTAVCQDSETAMEAFAELGGDVVVKPLFGSEGRGICRVSDPDVAFRTFRTLHRLGAVLYIQKFIEHPGYDTRILVLNGLVLGAMRRFGDGDFRTNVSRRGRCECYTPTDSECETAIRAAESVGATLAGIDLLTLAEPAQFAGRAGGAEPYVIEVNGVPGWRAFNRVNETDVASAVLHFLEAEM